jgi:hypothetical protein
MQGLQTKLIMKKINANTSIIAPNGTLTTSKMTFKTIFVQM